MWLLKVLLTSSLFKPKKLRRTIKRDAKFTIQLMTDIATLMNIIFKFIFVLVPITLRKIISQSKRVEEVKNDKVIDINEYRLKKAE